MAHVAAEQLHHSLHFDNTVIQAFTPKSCGCTLYLHEISDSKWTMLPLSNIIGNFAVKLSEAISGLCLEVTLKQQQTSGTRFLVSTGPGECRSKSTWKACADCWRPEQCTSLFIFRNKAWSPYGLPCYHIWLAWRDGVNILVSSLHEHCAVHVLDPAPCLVHMASTLDLLTRHCSVGFQRERHHW